ncbi:MAG: UV-damage endonuclease [Chrysothrix sp. TS-e1954]|nr:MAG: UV-damage endonuclease [Chrysothrix sp. TS-e1954]
MAKRKHASVSATAAPSVESMPPPPLPNGTSRRSSRRVSKAELDPATSNDVVDGKEALRDSPDGDMNEDIIPGKDEDFKAESDSALSDVPEEDAEPKPKRRAPPRKKAAVKSKKEEVSVKKEDVVPKRSARGSAAKAKKEEQPTKSEEVAPKRSAKAAAAAAATTKVKKEEASIKNDDTAPKKVKKEAKGDEEFRGDPEAEGDEEVDPEEMKEALGRPPPVNSDYLPLPWKGRLGYACLCTYLRNSNPAVFSSRTTRIASILEHRHPLKDPTQPEHPIKNRPDKEQPADYQRGQKFVEQLCLANVRDMKKMLRWNDRYGIKFMRLSSEAFPFASHADYGYKLAPFAADALAEVGKIVAELGHRVTTHPGQFTQLGSPRKPVIDNSFRDLEYHDEMLSLLKLPPQQDRDAVMILHMGGVFGDKAATLDRFRENYAKLNDSIKRRLVLENDDVSWGTHELLPVCKELNIPFVLDYHHNNIIFDSDKIREGTKDIIDYYPEIRETWTRKGITQKMHYSEPTPAAVTGKQRRKHNPRVASLPPCSNDMDLMIEAKDKEQAIFELMKTFKLPGYDTFNDIIPNVRSDDNKLLSKPKKKTPKKKGKKAKEDEEDEDEEAEDDTLNRIPDEDVGMGGPDGRVYWPPGMEEWLRPVKRVVKKKEPVENGDEEEKKPAAKKKAKKAKVEDEEE